MTKAALKALKKALQDENQNRADLRKEADRLQALASAAEKEAVEAEAACAELEAAIAAMTPAEPTEEEQVPA